jgi:type I restriction enzyme S subunit
MSSKSKNLRAFVASCENQKEEAKPALVTKLRFPEFRSEKGWTEKPLKAAAHINPATGGLPESFVYIELESVDAGELKAKERISRVGAPSRAQRLVQRGDIIYQVVRPYQRNNLLCEFDDDEDYVASTGYAQLRAKGSNRFLYQSIHTDSFVGRVIAKCTGSNYPAINSSDLAEIQLPIPPTLPEQQKIAECLSSVDELIAAQARKVDALKTHKKGLMQQLFPREGETQPRLRFPEFQNARKWETKELGKVAENLDNKRRPITSSDRESGDVPYYGASGIVDYVEGYIFDEDLLCVSEDGANLVARTYPIAFPISGKTWVNNHAHVLRFEATCTQKFVEMYLNSIKLDDFITGMAQPKLNKAMLDRIPIPHTTVGEQKRIVTCLSSLDSLITAETQKHEALKTHKKGLMQQLFPSMDEV